MFSAQSASVKTGAKNARRKTAGHPDIIPLPVARTGSIGNLAKRIFDFVVSAALIVLLSPLFLLISLAIVIDSPGAPFFRQRRKGYLQEPFWIYKFRTMRTHAHAQREEMFSKNEMDGLVFKMKNDPRVTSLGRFLRRYSLDELPQLFNVLLGDMSLVGPRPFSIEIFDRARTDDPAVRRWIRDRHRVLPGLSGLWQVSGRNELPSHMLMRLDLEYIQNRSFLMDIGILCKTFGAVLSKNGAY